MMVFAIIVAVIVLFLATRISVMAQYGQAGVLVRAGFGLIRLTVYPRKKKEKAQEKPKKEKKKKDKPEVTDEAKEKGGSVEKLKAGLSIVQPVFAQIKRRLVISELTLHYTASMPDAAMTALAYGGANMAASNLIPMICGQFRVKKRDIQIRADFDGGVEDIVFVRVKLSISVWGALCLGLFVINQVRKSGLLERKTSIQKGVTQHEQASN